MSRRRVVVTGLGIVTPLGFDLNDVWEAVCAGRSGVGLVQRFDCRDFKVRFGGEIRNFRPAEHIHFDAKDERRIDRFCQFALVAADKAIRQAEIDFTQGDSYRYGVKSISACRMALSAATSAN